TSSTTTNTGTNSTGPSTSTVNAITTQTGKTEAPATSNNSTKNTTIVSNTTNVQVSATPIDSASADSSGNASDNNVTSGLSLAPTVITFEKLSFLQLAIAHKNSTILPLRSDATSIDTEVRFTDSRALQEEESETGISGMSASEIKAAAALTSIGVALWALKKGTLLASLLAGIPAWQRIDPLHILEEQGDQATDEDDQYLDMADHMFTAVDAHKIRVIEEEPE
ncbi:MAG: hypothetical protein ACXU8A_10230, partial [Burkholderiaceae bacterium]